MRFVKALVSHALEPRMSTKRAALSRKSVTAS
jgi:hypothetical protein